MPTEHSDAKNERQLHCECGCETYHIKWNYDGEQWAVCSECGRPTATVGIGREKQQQWYSEQSDE